MKEVKIFIAILCICNAFNTTAQIEGTSTASNNENISELALIIKMDSVALATKMLKIDGVLEVEIDTKSQIVIVRHNTKKETVLKEIDKINKKIDATLVQYVKPIEKPVAVEQVKYNPEIDKYLNIEDTSIFSYERFKNLSVEQIHPRSEGYYLLICNIYNLKNLLKEVAELPLGQIAKAKEELSKAVEIINTINDNTDKCYKSALSEVQKDFYTNLVNEFNRLYSDIYE